MIINLYKKNEDVIKVIFALATLSALVTIAWNINESVGQQEDAKIKMIEVTQKISAMDSNFDTLQIMLLQSGLAKYGEEISVLQDHAVKTGRQIRQVNKTMNKLTDAK